MTPLIVGWRTESKGNWAWQTAAFEPGIGANMLHAGRSRNPLVRDDRR